MAEATTDILVDKGIFFIEYSDSYISNCCVKICNVLQYHHIAHLTDFSFWKLASLNFPLVWQSQTKGYYVLTSCTYP